MGRYRQSPANQAAVAKVMAELGRVEDRDQDACQHAVAAALNELAHYQPDVAPRGELREHVDATAKAFHNALQKARKLPEGYRPTDALLAALDDARRRMERRALLIMVRPSG